MLKVKLVCIPIGIILKDFINVTFSCRMCIKTPKKENPEKIKPEKRKPRIQSIQKNSNFQKIKFSKKIQIFKKNSNFQKNSNFSKKFKFSIPLRKR